MRTHPEHEGGHGRVDTCADERERLRQVPLLRAHEKQPAAATTTKTRVNWFYNSKNKETAYSASENKATNQVKPQLTHMDQAPCERTSQAQTHSKLTQRPMHPKNSHSILEKQATSVSDDRTTAVVPRTFPQTTYHKDERRHRSERLQLDQRHEVGQVACARADEKEPGNTCGRRACRGG